MQLVYLIEIFEDNYKTVRDRFETDSVNLIKKKADCCKETQRKFQYTNYIKYINYINSAVSENHGNCH